MAIPPTPHATQTRWPQAVSRSRPRWRQVARALRRAAELMQASAHPRVVRALGAFEDESHAYLLMELCSELARGPALGLAVPQRQWCSAWPRAPLHIPRRAAAADCPFNSQLVPPSRTCCRAWGPWVRHRWPPSSLSCCLHSRRATAPASSTATWPPAGACCQTRRAFETACLVACCCCGMGPVPWSTAQKPMTGDPRLTPCPDPTPNSLLLDAQGGIKLGGFSHAVKPQDDGAPASRGLEEEAWCERLGVDQQPELGVVVPIKACHWHFCASEAPRPGSR
jgi:hypothetical protein